MTFGDNPLMDNGSWFPKRPETEMRRVTAETLFDLEMECRRQGWSADPALVYDEEKDFSVAETASSPSRGRTVTGSC